MMTIARERRIVVSVDALGHDGSRDRFPRQQYQLVEKRSQVAPPAFRIRRARQEPASTQVTLAIDHELHVVRPRIGLALGIAKEPIDVNGIGSPDDREGKEENLRTERTIDRVRVLQGHREDLRAERPEFEVGVGKTRESFTRLWEPKEDEQHDRLPPVVSQPMRTADANRIREVGRNDRRVWRDRRAETARWLRRGERAKQIHEVPTLLDRKAMLEAAHR